MILSRSAKTPNEVDHLFRQDKILTLTPDLADIDGPCRVRAFRYSGTVHRIARIPTFLRELVCGRCGARCRSNERSVCASCVIPHQQDYTIMSKV